MRWIASTAFSLHNLGSPHFVALRQSAMASATPQAAAVMRLVDSALTASVRRDADAAATASAATPRPTRAHLTRLDPSPESAAPRFCRWPYGQQPARSKRQEPQSPSFALDAGKQPPLPPPVARAPRPLPLPLPCPPAAAFTPVFALPAPVAQPTPSSSPLPSPVAARRAA
jgi:hypothetical protein